MSKVISVEILQRCWSHDIFIRYFQRLFGDEEIRLTHSVLTRMRFEGRINLDMWFEAQFPELNDEYQARTQATREQFWTEYRKLRSRDPRVKHGHRDYMPQYHRHRAILKPLEETRDKECINIITQILGLPD